MMFSWEGRGGGERERKGKGEEKGQKNRKECLSGREEEEEESIGEEVEYRNERGEVEGHQ